MDFLAEMAAGSRQRAEGLDIDALRAIPARPGTLHIPGFTLIAELKFRAPSSGKLAAPVDVAERARAYVQAGAAAISVLTEPSRFDGSLKYLAEVSALPGALTMRKDFLVHPAQVWEARAHGASGVLLIARMLDEATLVAMLDAAAEAGLFVLLEAFDAADLARCQVDWSGAQPLLIGVNCRDLRTLQVEPGRFEALAAHLPPGRVCIAESGLQSAEDAGRVAELGYRGALVGSALMRSEDPVRMAQQMIFTGGRR